jgi:hypothetical protein
MTLEDAKIKAKALTELAENQKDLYNQLKGVSREVSATKRLWREGDKSKLIKIGVTLVLFPEPTPISETIGACFIAAGAIHKGIRSRCIYVDDIKKTFQSTLKEVHATKHNFQI